MKRKLAAFAPMMALLCWACTAAAQSFLPMRFEMAAYVKTDNRKRFENSKIWVKALDKFRIEQSAGAQTIMTIANGTDVWEVRTLNQICLHSIEKAEKVKSIGKQTVQAVNLLETFKKQGGRSAGKAKIDGVECTVYRRRDKGGMTHTLWVLPNGRIRRMLSSGYQRGAIAFGEPIENHSLESRVEFKWLPAAGMDEALFRPPAGMKVTERAPSK